MRVYVSVDMYECALSERVSLSVCTRVCMCVVCLGMGKCA